MTAVLLSSDSAVANPNPHIAIAALIGRFLPRLGPLVTTQAAILFCVRRHGQSGASAPRADVKLVFESALLEFLKFHIVVRMVRNRTYESSFASYKMFRGRAPRREKYSPTTERVLAINEA